MFSQEHENLAHVVKSDSQQCILDGYKMQQKWAELYAHYAVMQLLYVVGGCFMIVPLWKVM